MHDRFQLAIAATATTTTTTTKVGGDITVIYYVEPTMCTAVVIF